MKKERKQERRVKKKHECLKAFVGKDVIEPRYTASNKKAYDIKCPLCGFVASRLHDHLTKKHQLKPDEAKMEESKIRVLFSWSQKDKHGCGRPLPCEICKLWHSRLDIHLKNKHKYDNEKVKEVMSVTREKYWCNANGELKTVSTSSGIEILFCIPWCSC